MKYDRKLEKVSNWNCGICYSGWKKGSCNIDFYSKNEFIAQIDQDNWLFIPDELKYMTVTQRKHLQAFLMEYAPHVSQTDVDLIAGTAIGILINMNSKKQEA